MANPSGLLTGRALKRPGCGGWGGGDSFLHWAGQPSARDGKTRDDHQAFAQSRDWEPLWRKNITNHCQFVAAFVISEDELVGRICRRGAKDGTSSVHVKRIQPA